MSVRKISLTLAKVLKPTSAEEVQRLCSHFGSRLADPATLPEFAQQAELSPGAEPSIFLSNWDLVLYSGSSSL